MQLCRPPIDAWEKQHRNTAKYQNQAVLFRAHIQQHGQIRCSHVRRSDGTAQIRSCFNSNPIPEQYCMGDIEGSFWARIHGSAPHYTNFCAHSCRQRSKRWAYLCCHAVCSNIVSTVLVANWTSSFRCRRLVFANFMQSTTEPDLAWAATTKDQDYIRMEGMKRVVNDSIHRKELVAGNLKEFMTVGVHSRTNLPFSQSLYKLQSFIKRMNAYRRGLPTSMNCFELNH